MSTLSRDASHALRLLEGRDFDEKLLLAAMEERMAELKSLPDEREVSRAIKELGNLRNDIMRGRYHAPGATKSVFK